MRYLITGGAGFIGGHLGESLIADGHHVTAIDNLSTGSISNLEQIKEHHNFRFIQDDILTMSGLEQIVSGHDLVVHLAAAVGVELVVRDPVRTIVTNVHGTERMLEATAKLGKRIIIASTSEVYGKSTKNYFNEKDDLLIGCPTNSRWSYACSKLLDEFYLLAYHRDCGLNGTIVRFFNTVGPRQTGQYGMVVPRFVSSALQNLPIPVYGDGNQSRCFCHVFDTVRALRLLFDSDACNGKIFNIGSTHRITIKQLAEFVIKHLNSKSSLTYIPYEQAYEKGFEDMLHRAPDIGAIHSALGWSPELSLEKIIDDVATSIRLTQHCKNNK
jgi:UDP-glucose 4-epimerase